MCVFSVGWAQSEPGCVCDAGARGGNRSHQAHSSPLVRSRPTRLQDQVPNSKLQCMVTVTFRWPRENPGEVKGPEWFFSDPDSTTVHSHQAHSSLLVRSRPTRLQDQVPNCTLQYQYMITPKKIRVRLRIQNDPFRIRIPSQSTHTRLTPRPWSGPGILGFKIRYHTLHCSV